MDELSFTRSVQCGAHALFRCRQADGNRRDVPACQGICQCAEQLDTDGCMCMRPHRVAQGRPSRIFHLQRNLMLTGHGRASWIMFPSI